MRTHIKNSGSCHSLLMEWVYCVVSVLVSSGVICADGENEVKRGVFPFMAFLYYPDETVVDASGARFLRSAILIRPNWLISSAIDHSVIDNIPLGFPRKTFLARVGAISIDANFSLSEDEDEQEREVIQIVRPTIHSLDVWYFTDITLLKTLLPFNATSAVAPTKISPKRDYLDKICMILVYAKRYGNLTEDRILMQLPVELLPPSIDTCGTQFSTSMTCATDNEESKHMIYDPEFCQGNSGGPLICEGEVMGLQTYIDNSCKQPHLYQLLSAWDSFISCGIQEKCHLDYCDNICIVTPKDPPEINELASSTEASSLESITVQRTEVISTESTETTTSFKTEELKTSPVKPIVHEVADDVTAEYTSFPIITDTTKISQNPEIIPESYISRVPLRPKLRSTLISDSEAATEYVQRATPNIEAQLEKEALLVHERAHPENSAEKRDVRLFQTIFLNLLISLWVF